MQDSVQPKEYVLLTALKERAQKIRALEDQAQSCLDIQDIASYNEYLREKAEILEEFANDLNSLAEKDLQGNDKLLQETQQRLQNFAQRAAQALELDSPFFMSMLLYPEDYQPGQANDLEKFINYLEEQLLS